VKESTDFKNTIRKTSERNLLIKKNSDRNLLMFRRNITDGVSTKGSDNSLLTTGGESSMQHMKNLAKEYL
jgi:hypothetical protein